MSTYLNSGDPADILAAGFDVHQGTASSSISVTDFDYTNNNIMVFKTTTTYNVSFSGTTGTLVFSSFTSGTGNNAYVTAWSVTSSSFTINITSGSVGYCAIPKTSVFNNVVTDGATTHTQNIAASDWNDYNMLFIFGGSAGYGAEGNINLISLMTNASYGANGYMGFFYVTENATSIKYYESWSGPEIIIKVPKSVWPIPSGGVRTLKYYNGTSWIECYANYYDGTQFNRCDIHRYDGTDWD